MTTTPPITPNPRRRWLQFSLRALMLASLLVALGLGYFCDRAQSQRKAVASLKALGGSVEYDDELDRSGDTLGYRQPRGPAWMRKMLGDDYFAAVIGVDLSDSRATDVDLVHLRAFTNLWYLSLGSCRITNRGLQNVEGLSQLEILLLQGTRITDAGLKHGGHLSRLRVLSLASTQVTDRGLEHLKGLTQLRHLDLPDTQVTLAGVAQLQKALPNCEIVR